MGAVLVFSACWSMMFNLTVGMSAWASAWFVTGWDYENSFCDSLYGFALPSCNLKPTQKAPLQDERCAGLASYGHGYLEHNAHNCLNMAVRRGAVQMLQVCPGAWDTLIFCQAREVTLEELPWKKESYALLKILTISKGQKYLLARPEPGTYLWMSVCF